MYLSKGPVAKLRSFPTTTSEKFPASNSIGFGPTKISRCKLVDSPHYRQPSSLSHLHSLASSGRFSSSSLSRSIPTHNARGPYQRVDCWANLSLLIDDAALPDARYIFSLSSRRHSNPPAHHVQRRPEKAGPFGLQSHHLSSVGKMVRLFPAAHCCQDARSVADHDFGKHWYLAEEGRRRHCAR